MLKRRDFLKLSAVSAGAAAFSLSDLRAAAGAAKKNVLFIGIDDYRTLIGSYGDKMAKTPNLDAFSKTALQFNNAYTQEALCGPSRCSLFSGLRPDTLGIIKLGQKGHVPEDTTVMNKHFKEGGYRTSGCGKLFHGLHKLEQQGWTEPYYKSPKPLYNNPDTLAFVEEKTSEAKEQGLKGKKLRQYIKGPSNEMADVPDNAYKDGDLTDHTLNMMEELKNDPFFLAIGYKKPHLPLCAPKKYWDMFKRSDFKLPENDQPPAGSPPYALANVTNGELHAYGDIERKKKVPEEKGLELIHAYYACASFIDAQIGRLFKGLKEKGLEENTIVIIWADHGWKLGEYSAWSKHTNYQLDTRVPMYIRIPGVTTAGTQTDALVELIDMFPTLVEATGLPKPKLCEGKSFMPVIKKPDIKWKKAAFSQYPKGKRMGYTIKTRSYRYVEWINRESGKIEARELYDHTKDPGENISLAKDPKYKKVVASLSKVLDKGLGWKKMN
jgi:iduronate 2-sulfatase